MGMITLQIKTKTMNNMKIEKSIISNGSFGGTKELQKCNAPIAL